MDVLGNWLGKCKHGETAPWSVSTEKLIHGVYARKFLVHKVEARKLLAREMHGEYGETGPWNACIRSIASILWIVLLCLSIHSMHRFALSQHPFYASLFNVSASAFMPSVSQEQRRSCLLSWSL